MTVAELIAALERRFVDANLAYGHGTDNAWDEAVALVLTVTDFPDDESSLARVVAAPKVDVIHSMARRRIEERVPLAYVLGRCTYCGLEFEVEPGVMVPRSPIGHLLGAGLTPWVEAPRRILDLCAGTGCLGIIAAFTYPAAEVTLVELDDLALEVAQRNITRHGLTDRVRLEPGDLATVDIAERYDLIVSNPPYVADTEMDEVPPEYLAEPRQGFVAGADGLDRVEHILRRARQWLTTEGVLVCEVGASRGRFEERYAALPVIWLDLPQGGEGVFLLEARGLNSHTPRPWPETA